MLPSQFPPPRESASLAVGEGEAKVHEHVAELGVADFLVTVRIEKLEELAQRLRALLHGARYLVARDLSGGEEGS